MYITITFPAFQNGESKAIISASDSTITPLSSTTAVLSKHPTVTNQSSFSSNKTNASGGMTDDETDIEMPPPMTKILTTHPIPGSGSSGLTDSQDDLHEKLVSLFLSMIVMIYYIYIIYIYIYTSGLCFCLLQSSSVSLRTTSDASDLAQEIEHMTNAKPVDVSIHTYYVPTYNTHLYLYCLYYFSVVKLI